MERELGALAAGLGDAARAERERRHLPLREVAAAAGLSLSAVHAVESGRVASLSTYVRLARALRLKPEFGLVDPRRRSGTSRAQDPVHAAMGEMEAAQFRALGFEVRLDEPFQHYQFAGRGDLVAWSTERAALLHIENRTSFPNLQEAFGSFNAKRAYLGVDLGGRVGIKSWRSETHVMAVLWSSEVLRTIKQHRASFESVDCNGLAILENWWLGDPPATGRLSASVLLDPIRRRRRGSTQWSSILNAATIRPRYRGYAEALAALMEVGQA